MVQGKRNCDAFWTNDPMIFDRLHCLRTVLPVARRTIEWLEERAAISESEINLIASVAVSVGKNVEIIKLFLILEGFVELTY